MCLSLSLDLNRLLSPAEYLFNDIDHDQAVESLLGKLEKGGRRILQIQGRRVVQSAKHRHGNLLHWQSILLNPKLIQTYNPYFKAFIVMSRLLINNEMTDNQVLWKRKNQKRKFDSLGRWGKLSSLSISYLIPNLHLTPT